ncbi:hypothetical protein ACFFX0_18170 [Citricoccus parietis]|uniref:Uncharacterized protein n=1 Tax=Citricoccus parietis TaxID=592307 RepID=A0ABV5G301_9MICC
MVSSPWHGQLHPTLVRVRPRATGCGGESHSPDPGSLSSLAPSSLAP